MPVKLNKVFVYGTLLQGEIRNPFMKDCRLLRTMYVPGALYDTNRAYPTAIFDNQANTNVLGELYLMDHPESKLKQLDEVEMLNSNQYKRVILNHNELDFFTYAAGPQLQECCRPDHLIEHGNWRRYSSLCFHDPLLFAVNFEERQKYLYREPACSDADGLIYIKGDFPLIITAPHSTVHKRMGKLKRQEFYTGSLSAMLHSLTGCHVLYTNRLMELDPNFYDESPFKRRLAEIIEENSIKCLIDLHGTGLERDYEIYPGVGIDKEFLLSHDNFLDELESHASINGISVGGLDVFPAAKQMTVTKYAARKFKVPSIQVEINKKLREPEKNPQDFIKLIKFLKDYLDILSNLIS